LVLVIQGEYILNRLCLRGGAVVFALLAFFLLVSDGTVVKAGDIDSVLRNACSETVADQAMAILGPVDLPDDEVAYLKKTLDIFHESGFPAGTCLDYVNLISGLVKADISLEDLTSKVREGIAKGASPERITFVIRDRADWLKRGRVIVLSLENEGVTFLNKQMAYRVMADYLTRGVSPDELTTQVVKRELSDYPALENVIK
jgi:hypothetical protein